jgi:hypothetical protein
VAPERSALELADGAVFGRHLPRRHRCRQTFEFDCLRDHRIERAVLMVRGTEIAQPSVPFGADPLGQRLGEAGFAGTRFGGNEHHSPMERAAGFRHEDDPATKLAKLQALLARTAPPIEDVALIAELHSLPSSNLAPPLDVTPQRKKDKTFEALLRQVESLSRQQAGAMVFDDLHWIDPSSRELSDRVIERVADCWQCSALNFSHRGLGSRM